MIVKLPIYIELKGKQQNIDEMSKKFQLFITSYLKGEIPLETLNNKLELFATKSDVESFKFLSVKQALETIRTK